MFRVVRLATPEALALSHRHQWPVQMAAFYTEDDSPAAVFVMRKSAPGEFSRETFSCVASAQQMDDLPVDDPDTTGPYYRTATVLVLARSADAAKEFADKVTEAIQDLANNLAAASQLTVAEETIITPNV